MISRRATTLLLVAALLVVLWANASLPAYAALEPTWPAAGILTVVLMRVSRARRLRATCGLAAGSLLALVAGGTAPALATATAVAISGGGLVAARVAQRGPAPFEVRDARVLMRFAAAVAAGSAVSVASTMLVLALLGEPVPADLLIARAAGSASAMLVLMPLHRFLLPEGPKVSQTANLWGDAEAWAQRATMGLLAAFCFVQPWYSVMPVVLVLPLLWSALRAGRREMTLQAAAACLVAYATATLGLGPASVAIDRGHSPLEILVFTFAFAGLVGAFTVPPDLAVRAMQTASARERRASRTFQRLMSATDDLAIVLTDARGVVQQANEQAASVYGVPPHDLSGRPLPWSADEGLLGGGGHDGADTTDLPTLLTALAGQRHADRHVRLPDGSLRWFDVRVVEVVDEDVHLGYLITATDVTERAEIEQTLRRALQRETDSLRMLQDTDRVKDELVSTISHELRTPITSILGYVEMLGEELEDAAPSLGRLLEPVSRNAHRLHRLVDDLLLLDALEHGDTEPHRRAIDLGCVVTDAIVAADANARRSVVVRRGPGLRAATISAIVEANGAHLRRMVDALIDNAVKFSPENGTVTVDLVVTPNAADAPGSAELLVHDEGTGIADHDLSRVFDRFYRSSSAYADQIQGSGLGLALCKAVVEDHGGGISISAGDQTGTTATVRLPVSDTTPVQHDGHDPARGEAPALMPPRSMIAAQRGSADDEQTGAAVA